MSHTNKFAKIPDAAVASVSELEKQIKQTTSQDVVCIVYEKT